MPSVTDFGLPCVCCMLSLSLSAVLKLKLHIQARQNLTAVVLVYKIIWPCRSFSRWKMAWYVLNVKLAGDWDWGKHKIPEHRSKTGHRRILSLPVLQVITIGFWILRKTGSESAAQRVQTGRTVIHAFLSEGESSLNRSWCVFSLFMYCLHPKRYHCYCSRSQ